MTQQLFPYGQASSGSPIGGPYPAVQFVPTEAQGVVCEIREIQGAIWTVQNATFNTTTLQWTQVNVLLQSFAFVRMANGTNQFLSAAAVGSGVLPVITFIVSGAFSTQPAGKPGGRLTLTSGSPVMPADVANSPNVYYDPYQTNLLPIFNGLTWTSFSFAELTLSLQAANNVATNVYDVFAFANGAVAAIGTGPAWTSQTARGTGAGTTQIQLSSGLWVNAVSITLWNGGVSTVVPAGQATYLGSIYCNATAAVTMNFKPAAAVGGSNNILGLYNAYNRVLTRSVERDAQSVVYASVTWRPLNASTANAIAFLDGLQQSSVEVRYTQLLGCTANSSSPEIGVNLDSIVATPLNIGSAFLTNFTNAGEIDLTGVAADIFNPVLGLHVLTAMQSSGSSITATYYAAGSHFQTFIATLEM